MGESHGGKTVRVYIVPIRNGAGRRSTEGMGSEGVSEETTKAHYKKRQWGREKMVEE